MEVAGLWSGGKDSCFACYQAISLGHRISALVNFTQEGSCRSLSHGISAGLINRQAVSAGFKIIQKPVVPGGYSQVFKDVIGGLKESKGIRGVVFGDIYLLEHRDWLEKLCKETGIEAIFPIWGRDTGALAAEIIGAGFKSIVVSARAEFIGSVRPGEDFDKTFVGRLGPGIDPCGEKGEFHTFIYDGPFFKYPVEFTAGKKELKDGHWLLELLAKNPDGGLDAV
ncbi:MAG: diphthine--ammonia ligase [Candidatus Omnitrophica bacterium]|nr:diphthine--ammonia ligase [Candidatus Omnitrophota bacterium]